MPVPQSTQVGSQRSLPALEEFGHWLCTQSEGAAWRCSASISVVKPQYSWRKVWLTPTGAITRICCVSVAPGLIVGFDIGSICSCWVCRSVLIIFIPFSLLGTHLWHRCLEVHSQHWRPSQRLELDQNHHNPWLSRRRLGRERHLQPILLVRSVLWALRRRCRRCGSGCCSGGEQRWNSRGGCRWDRVQGRGGLRNRRCTRRWRRAKESEDVVDGRLPLLLRGRGRSCRGRWGAEDLCKEVLVGLSGSSGLGRSGSCGCRRDIVTQKVSLDRN